MKASLTFFILYFFLCLFLRSSLNGYFFLMILFRLRLNFVIILFQPFRLTMMLQTKQCFFAKEGK